MVAAALVWLGTPTASPLPIVSAPLHAYGYDAALKGGQLVETAMERGPPAINYDYNTTHPAVGSASHGTAERASDPLAPDTYDYDPDTGLAQVDHIADTTTKARRATSVDPSSLQPGQAAAKTADDFVGPLSKAEYDGLQKALEPNSLNHLFAKQQHGLDGLVERYGSQEAVVEQMYRGLSGAVTPSSEGLFSVTRSIGGQAVTIDGRVVNGIPRIGTAYIKP